MSKAIKFSIITIVYNDAVGLERTFKSVQSQSYKNYEHIIIDGASTDDTSGVIEKYRDDKTRVTSEPDEGIYDAMNKGLKQVEGDYFQILNAGDMYASSTVIESISGALISEPIDVLYGDCSFFNKSGKTVRYWPATKYGLWKVYCGWLPSHSAIVARKSLIKNYGHFDKQYSIAADTELLMRWFLDKKLKFLCINQHLTSMETGGTSNSSLRGVFRAWKQVTRAWFRHKPLFALVTPTLKVLQKSVQYFRLKP